MESAREEVRLNVDLKERRAMRDQRLAADAQGGSSAVFEQIQRNYRPRLYRTILAITRNHEDAEDALQDTFLKAYMGLQGFEGRSSLYSWLTRIAINTALMLLRKRRIGSDVFFDSRSEEGSAFAVLEFKDTSPTPEQLFAERQQWAGLFRAIQRLEPKLREPILIHLGNESSMKDIAIALNISVGAVKARLHRARTRLKTTATLKPYRSVGLSRAS